jgi:hypothetical protein
MKELFKESILNSIKEPIAVVENSIRDVYAVVIIAVIWNTVWHYPNRPNRCVNYLNIKFSIVD